MRYNAENGYQPKKGNIIKQPPHTISSNTLNKYNDNVILTNNKLIKLIDLIQISLNNPETDVTYELDLLRDDLESENYYIRKDDKYEK